MTLTFTSDVTFTSAARLAMDGAARYAAGAGAAMIEPEHLLLALLDAPGSVAVRTLRDLGADPVRLRAALGGGAPTSYSERPPLSEATRQLQLAAYREAQHLGHYQVDALHLLMGALYDGQLRAAQALDAEGVTLFELRQRTLGGPRRWTSYGWRSYLERVREAVQVSPVFWGLLALWLASGAGLWFATGEQYVRPLTMLFVICGWMVSLCLHEFGHALAAYLGGDSSVRASGYLSLNPLRYANPLFSFILPVLFLLLGGLGLPGGAVYVNVGALRNDNWRRIVSAAGPLGTIIFGLLAVAPFWLIGEESYLLFASPLWPALALLGFTQVSALLFNLLPIPPLDGFGILEPSLAPGLRDRMRMLSPFTLMILFTILWNDNPITDAFWRSIFGLSEAVGIPLWLIGDGLRQFMLS